MLAPDELFSSPLLKDLRTQRLEIVTRLRVFAGIAATTMVLTPIYTVPRDRVFVLSNIGVRLSSGAGPPGIPLQWQAFMEVDGAAVEFGGGDLINPGLVPQADYAGTQSDLQVWCPPGAILGVYVNVSLPSALWSTNVSVLGVTFPRGNVSVS